MVCSPASLRIRSMHDNPPRSAPAATCRAAGSRFLVPYRLRASVARVTYEHAAPRRKDISSFHVQFCSKALGLKRSIAYVYIARLITPMASYSSARHRE